jgi:hypothetical protein
MDDDRVQFQLREEQTQKLTDWTKEPDLASLKGDLESAKPSHDAMISKIQEWNDLMYVKGSAAPKKVPNRSSVQPKLIKKQAEWRYSALTEPFLSADRLFQVKPVTFEDGKAAKQNEIVLNHQFRTKMNRVKLIDNYVRSCVDDGTVIVKLGWDRVVRNVKVKKPTYDHFPITTEEEMGMFQQALQLREVNPSEYESQIPPEVKAAVDYFDEAGSPTVARMSGEITVDEDKVFQNRPTVDVLNPQNVFIDPSCQGDMSKALFITYSFETNKAELKKEPKRYKNLDKVNWEDNAPLYEADHASTTPMDFNLKDRARKKVIAYEYWGFYDIGDNDELVPIVVTWIGNVIVRMEISPFPYEMGLPFVLVPYNPVKRDLYGEPDAEILGDNQKISGAVTRGAIDLMGRSANSQRGIQKGLLDPLNRRRYDRGEDYEFNPSQHPEQGIINHKYPEIPQSVMTMLALQNHEAEALTGVKSFSGGISGDSYGQVVAGIKGALDAAAKREMSILRRLVHGMEEIASKIVVMNSLLLSEKEIVRISNEEFVEISREDLAGQFDMEIDISTAEVDNIKAQDLGFLLQTMGPNSDPEIAMMILSEIAHLKRMPELSKRLGAWKPPPPDPMVVAMQQAELEKVQAETAKLQSETVKNQALAEKASSEADMVALSFVEEESGVKHERDKEKLREQARANQALQITKAMTSARKKDTERPDIEGAIGFNAISDRLTEATASE